MSSSPLTSRWRPGSWSLRARLLAIMLVILAGLSVFIGAVTAVATQRILVAQIDDRLQAGSGRMSPDGRVPGLGPGALVAVVKRGAVGPSVFLPGPGRDAEPVP